MGKLTPEIFNESCCDGGECNKNSAMPCGCDPGAKHVCAQHTLKALPTSYLKKEHLVKGNYYVGFCRNARIARWDGEKFLHWREKFGRIFVEEIRHPEDEAYFDVFQPVSHCPDFQAKPIILPDEPPMAPEGA